MEIDVVDSSFFDSKLRKQFCKHVKPLLRIDQFQYIRVNFHRDIPF